MATRKSLSIVFFVDHFKLICKFIFGICFHKMAAGDHFEWLKITFNRISRHFNLFWIFFSKTANLDTWFLTTSIETSLYSRSVATSVTNLVGVTIWATRRMKQTRSVDGIIWFNIKQWFQLLHSTDYLSIHTVHTQYRITSPVPTDGFITSTGHGRRPAGSNPLEYTNNTRLCIMTPTGDDRLLYNQDRPLPTTLYTFYPVG